MKLDLNDIRGRFPILERTVGDKPLVYLDNTATSQTPREVVEAVVNMYEHYKANVHRGVQTLWHHRFATDSATATRLYSP